MITFPAITALCAGILGVLAVVLAGYVGAGRGKAKVGIGDGDDADLLCRIRKHGNFTEYAPLALVLLALLEMSGAASAMAISILGAALVAGRILHPMGLKQNGAPTALRAIGISATLLMMLVSSIWLIYNYLTAM